MAHIVPQEGELVRLKSGGPVMTAEYVFADVRAPYARCAWFDARETAKSAAFSFHALERVEPQETEP